MPFNNSDTLFYDTLTFTQTYPFNYLDNDGASAPYSNATENYSGYGSGVAFMQVSLSGPTGLMTAVISIIRFRPMLFMVVWIL